MRNHPPPLGEISVDQFMRRQWQRRPLLVRNAIPGITPPVSRDELFAMAGRDDVESRLVSRRGKRWQVSHGPIDASALPDTHQRQWTLLVQGMDLHAPAARALLDRFRFLPDARLDDLMISWASDGGGVGPHTDSYDVFLVQVQGRRRWRIAPPGPTPLLPDAPLRILAQFEPTETWVLEPGDMLYLPPQWAHEGTAEGECMTCSVGFRAPSRHELLRGFLADCADEPGGPDPRHTDPGLPPTRQPGRIPEPLAASMSAWLSGWRPTRAQIDDYLGRFLTEPKPQVWFEPPARMPALPRWWAQAQQAGLIADRRTRLAWRGARLFINGESVPAGAATRALLRRLADQRGLEPARLAGVSADSALAEMLHDWFAAGWLQLPARHDPRNDQSA
jgi:50S ribosomal protein L16 3-hydroxylase